MKPRATRSRGKPRRKPRKNDLPVGVLIPQPHGGAIRNGGTNKGGTGPPPSTVIERCRGSFYDRVHILEELADSVSILRSKCEKCGHVPKDEVTAQHVEPRDRIRAVDRLGFYGSLNASDVDADMVRSKLDRTITLIGELLQPADAQAVLIALRRVWAA
jgi:hypothetical protein